MATVVPTCANGATDTTIKTDADMIRSRLLYKLGIYDSNFTNASIYHKMRCERSKKKSQQQRQQKKQTRRPLSSSQEESQDTRSGSTQYFVPLKLREDLQEGDHTRPHHISSNLSSSLSFSEDDGSHSELPASMNESKSRQPSVVVQFDPSVAILPIPSHRSYSQRMRDQLYIPQEELASAIVRNTREFVYEGWDWYNVIEEDRMYTSKATGEFVHPAHVGYTRVNPYL